MLGDFGSSPQSSEWDMLRKEKLCALVPCNEFTNISTRSPQGTHCLDNIWVSRSLKKLFSGESHWALEGRDGFMKWVGPTQVMAGLLSPSARSRDGGKVKLTVE